MAFGETTIEGAAAVLRRGEPVIFPTDTVYGLGVSVRDAESPDALYALKGRDESKPIAWLVGDVEDLAVFGAQVPDFAFSLARAFWPGPLTIVVKAGDAVPSAFRSHTGTIGLRMPANDTALALIRATGCPLATTSANKTGEPAVYRASDLDPELAEGVGAVVSDDRPKSGVASTVLDCSGEHPEIRRVGAITAAEMQALL